MDKCFLELLNKKTQLTALLETNKASGQYGLTLTKEDAQALLEERKSSLISQKRVELNGGILPKIIDTFMDSAYISQEDYVDTLVRLQDLFFQFKNEMNDEITDEELLNFMKEQFETICYGDLDYLGGTCLEIFAEAVRAGYQGYIETEGRDAYKNFDEVARFDKEMYLEALDRLLN